jgi:8-oxo-dGTP pyrophosphatase MutT (NUDIX family)
MLVGMTGFENTAPAMMQATSRGVTADHAGCGPGCTGVECGPCVAQLASPADRLRALGAAIGTEREPLVALTHLLHLCRDEHRVLWEQVSEPASQARVAVVLAVLAELLPATVTATVIDEPVRHAMAAALEPVDGLAPVVVAHALAQFLDERYGDSFTDSFRRRSPYQPGAGDPVPLGNPNVRTVLDMRPTSPPWRLANRLDETRRIRLAGEWAIGFRVVYDYGLFDTLAGLVTPDTIIATCHPNRSLDEFALPKDRTKPAFPIQPTDPDRQRQDVNRLIAAATTAGASIVVLPELCVTEQLAFELEDWVRRPNGPQLLVAGSYHHGDDHGQGCPPHRRRNTALAWVRGHDEPLTHDKHSPADRPVIEDIQPEGWPELRVYVSGDGWHLVIAICRDLLNPQAVHALTEAGANLVLVPAMSETLVAFGGPAAQLVGSDQALVAVANNPATWVDGPVAGTRRPARALFGHPGFGQQTRLVHGQDAEPGIALLSVRSGQIRWQATPASAPPNRRGKAAPRAAPEPAWVTDLTDDLHSPTEDQALRRPLTLRPAAVLVLLTDGPTGPQVMLTQRAPDLGDYPDQLVFPGGATDPADDSPIATALREAAEEVGLDPATVHVMGLLPAFALPDSGFLVTPVLAWSARPEFTSPPNAAEVATVCHVALSELASRVPGGPRPGRAEGTAAEPVKPDLNALGRMTGTVIDVLLAILMRRGSPRSAPPASPRAALSVTA